MWSVLEYGMLTWIGESQKPCTSLTTSNAVGASQKTLHQLANVQRCGGVTENPAPACQRPTLWGRHRKTCASLPTSNAVRYMSLAPVLEYGILTWIGASQKTLHQLANVQCCALHVISPGSFLPSLRVRGAVAALCFLY